MCGIVYGVCLCMCFNICVPHEVCVFGCLCVCRHRYMYASMCACTLKFLEKRHGENCTDVGVKRVKCGPPRVGREGGKEETLSSEP